MRADSLRAGQHGEEATEFYLANREAMDKGAHIAWPERHHPDEISALQHAMNLRLRDEAAFSPSIKTSRSWQKSMSMVSRPTS